MLFSIIVPVYNVENYLDTCVKSILEQDYPDFELILVDDGAKDGSPAICDRWAEQDGRVRVIHKPNGGLSDARNVGTQAASGDYIVYVDSDDYIGDVQFLSKLAQKALSGSPDVIVYKFRKYYDAQNRLEDCAYGFPDFAKYTKLPEQIAYLVKTDSFYCSAWSKSIKRSVLTDSHIEFEKGLLGEDQEWYYHVLSVIQSFDGIDEPFVVYRQRANSITSSWKLKNLTDCIYVVKKWAEAIRNAQNLEPAYQTALLHSIAKLYCNLLIAYCRFDNPEKKQYTGQLKELSYLLRYDWNPRVRKVGLVYKIFGFTGVMLFLTLLCKVR